MTATTLVALLSTGAFAQHYGYPTNSHPHQPNRYGHTQGYGQSNHQYDFDNYQFDRHLDWWDRELNLSRKQEREIRHIRERFNQQTQGLNPRDPRQRDFFRQARQREFFDMMAVLHPDQRDRVIDRMRPFEQIAGRSRSYGNGRGPGYGLSRY